MSETNVEIVRRLIEASRSDDVGDAIDTAVGLCDPAVEFISVMAAVEPRTYRGHDGLRRYFGDLAEAWKEWRFAVDEASDVDAHTVVVGFRTRLVGSGSGVEVEARRGMVVVLSAGKVLRAHTFPSWDEALDAARRGDT